MSMYLKEALEEMIAKNGLPRVALVDKVGVESPGTLIAVRKAHHQTAANTPRWESYEAVVVLDEKYQDILGEETNTKRRCCIDLDDPDWDIKPL